MAALAPLPPLPAQFKSIQHHLRTAQEHDKRDPVVAYYCESLRVAVLRSRGPPVPDPALDRSLDLWPAPGSPTHLRSPGPSASGLPTQAPQ